MTIHSLGEEDRRKSWFGEDCLELGLGRATTKMSVGHPSGDEWVHTSGEPRGMAQGVPWVRLKCL